MSIQLAMELREEAAHLAAVTEVTTDPSRIGEDVGRALAHVARALRAQGITAAGPPFAVYRTADAGGWHVTAGFPVDRRVAEQDGLRPLTLAAGRVAVGTHVGAYDTIRATWNGVEHWVAEHGLRPAGPPFERYLTGPAQSTDPSHWRTEICWPVA